jgi:hypothetical protein
MTAEDRELLLALRRQQKNLQESVARLDQEIEALEARAQLPEPAAPQGIASEPRRLPPLPIAARPFTPPSALPPLPARALELPPLPGSVKPPPILPPIPRGPRPSLEFQFGKWLTRIGAVFGVFTLVFIFSLTHGFIFRHLGPGGILGLSVLFCVGIVVVAERLEHRGGGLLVFARSLMALGLAGLYVTFYAAHGFESVRIIQSPIAAGILLLLWSVYVLSLAERKGSQAFALFAVALAYFSTAINPVGRFSMAADLLLAGTTVAFLLRRGWAGLSYLSLIGTYFALLRRLVIDENGELVLDTGRVLPFTPYAAYLIGAWIIFTAGVLMTKLPSFRGGKRLGLLSLNNGSLAGLLTLTTYLAGYGDKAMGWTLLWTGLAFLATSRCVGWRRSKTDAAELIDAYIAQGLAVFTAGLMGICAGVTRGVLLAIEALILGFAGATSRGVVLKIAAYGAALLAFIFLGWEIAVNAHHSWLLGFGGAAVMLANAWWARRDVRHTPLTRSRIVLSASYYCALALGLIALAMATELSDAMLPPALALAAVVLTFSIYLLPLYELPPLAQTLLIAAQALVLFPVETGEALPRASTAWVAGLTLLLLAWWSRQRITRYGSWILVLNFIYALAVVGLAYHAVRPYVDAPTWMISASLLSVAFLLFGAVTRVWALAAMGQLFLAASLYHFFLPNGAPYPFPWTWWTAAVPIAVVFATGRSGHAWLRAAPEVREPGRGYLRLAAYGYQLLALLMGVRLILALVPGTEQIGTLFLLGTLLLAWNTFRPQAFGARCSFILSAVGVWLVLQLVQADERALVTFLNGVAILAFLGQPALLRHGARGLIGETESWLVVLLSAAMGWIFVGAWVTTRIHLHYLTMGWALYALFLFVLGLVGWERRQRWCGLAILGATMVRVLCSDIWGFSTGYKVLTFVVLTLITLGLGFVYARFGERLKIWL